MSKHTLEIPPADDIDGGAMYADLMIVDEGGIDLKVDGETILGASFEGLNPLQIAYEVLPESFLLVEDVTAHEFEEGVQTLADEERVSDEDLAQSARLFLTALARRNGYEK